MTIYLLQTIKDRNDHPIQIPVKQEGEVKKDESGNIISVEPVISTLTLKDVVIRALLTPVQKDDEAIKTKKYDLWKAVKNSPEPCILKSEQVAFIKSLIALFEPQLIMGQCFEMLENDSPAK